MKLLRRWPRASTTWYSLCDSTRAPSTTCAPVWPSSPGSTPYAAYHSDGDVPSVVDPDQLERTARLVVAWVS